MDGIAANWLSVKYKIGKKTLIKSMWILDFGLAFGYTPLLNKYCIEVNTKTKFRNSNTNKETVNS